MGKVESPATRKRQKTGGDDAVQEEGRELLKAIDRLTEKRTHRAIAGEFMKLPSRKLYPDYYKLIKKPMALDLVQDNLDDGEYVTLDLMREDLLQMCNNAKRYNQKGSVLYSDAAQIAKLVKQWSNDAGKYSEDSDAEDTSKEVAMRAYRTMLNQTVKGILKELKETKDRSGRKYIDIFLELPDKKLYPDYYTIITDPMSISTLEVRMKKNPYMKLDRFRDHINLIWQNAFTYNDAKSYVAQDAKHLQKIVNRLIDEARPKVEAQERELEAQAKADARAREKSAAAASTKTGSFKIKLGLRQSTPVQQTPIPKVKLNLLGSRKSQAPAQNLGTPVARKSATPVPVEKPNTPANATPEISTPVASIANTLSDAQNEPVAPAATTTTRPAVVATQTPPLPPAPVLVPPPVFEEPIVYANAGTPLVQCLSLCASQMQPPTILHVPAVAGIASSVYSWTLPIVASAMTVSPTLCPTLLDGSRRYSLSLGLNGRKVTATRQASGGTPNASKNSIWDLKLSAGMNCIECITEAADVAGGNQARERLAILVFLR